MTEAKIAIAGAAGRIGRSLIHNRGNREIIALSHTEPVKPRAGVTVLSGFDITDYEQTQRYTARLRKMGAQAIIVCSGSVAVDNAEVDQGIRDTMYRVHVDGARNIAKAADLAGIAVVKMSTEYVFFGKEWSERYNETDEPSLDPLKHPTWYGYTSARAEMEVLQRMPHQSAVIRLAQIQGPYGGLFSATLRELRKGEPFQRVCNQLVSPVSDATATEGIFSITDDLVNRGSRSSGIYHLSSTDAYTSFEVCKALAQAYGFESIAEENMSKVTLEELVARGEQRVLRPYNSILATSRVMKRYPTLLRTVAEEAARYQELYHQAPNFETRP